MPDSSIMERSMILIKVSDNNSKLHENFLFIIFCDKWIDLETKKTQKKPLNNNKKT